MNTVAEFVARLIRDRQLGYWMALAGMDAGNVTGTNPFVVNALTHAMSAMGQRVAIPGRLSDADVVAMSDPENTATEGVLDIAQLRILEQANMNLLTQAEPCIKLPEGVTLLDMSTKLDRIIDRLTRKIDKYYSTDLHPPMTGTIDLSISREDIGSVPPGTYQ